MATRAALAARSRFRCSAIHHAHTLDAPTWSLPLPEGVLGTVEKLYCKVGSRVYESEVVAVIETDKVAVDVHAQRSGVITAILVDTGEEVKVRQPLYAVNTDAEIPEMGSETHEAERLWARAHECVTRNARKEVGPPERLPCTDFRACDISLLNSQDSSRTGARGRGARVAGAAAARAGRAGTGRRAAVRVAVALGQ